MSLSFPSCTRFTECIVAAALLHMATADCVWAENRTFDGTGNNITRPEWGAASNPAVGRHVQLQRVAPSTYDDGIATPAGTTRPSARDISNAVSTQSGSVLNDRQLGMFPFRF